MKKTLLWILGILLVPVVLFVVLAALLYVPPVQNWAVQQVVKAASGATGMDISVGRVSLVFPLDLGIYGFRVTQPNDSLPQRRDTIADVGRLVVDVGLGQLLHSKVTVDALELEDARLNTAGLVATARIKGSIGRLSLSSRGIDLAAGVAEVGSASLSDARVSIELCDTVTPPDTASATVPWKIYVGRLDIVRTGIALSTPGDTIGVRAGIDRLTGRRAVVDLERGRYTVAAVEWAGGSASYDNNYAPRTAGLDPNHIALSGIEIGIDSVVYEAPLTQLNLKYCRMEEKSGLRLADLSGQVSMDSVRLSLPALTLRTPDSDLRAQAAMDFSVMDERNPGRLELRLLANIGKQDVMRFAGELPAQFVRAYPNRPISLRATLSGTVRQLDLTGIDVSLPTAFRLSASGSAANVTSPERLQADIRLRGRTENLGFVTALAGPQPSFRIPGGMALEGRVGADGSAYTAALTLREGRGSVKLDGRLNTVTEAYRALLAVDGLDVTHFLPGDSLFTVSCRAEAEGRGFDFLAPSCRLQATAAVDTLVYGSLGVGRVEAGATLAGGKGHVSLAGTGELFEGNIDVHALLSRAKVRTTVVADLRNADLYRLHLTEHPLSTGLCAHLDFASDMKQSHSLKGSVADIRIESGKMAFRPTDINMDISTSPDTTWAMVSSGSLDLQMAARGGYEAMMAQVDRLMAEAVRQREEKIIDQSRLSRLLPRLRLRLVSGDGNPFANFLKTKGVLFDDLSLSLNSSPERGLNGNMHLYSLMVDSTMIDTVRFFMVQDSVSRVRFVGKVANRKDNPQLAFTTLFNGFYYETEAGLNARFYDAADSLGAYIGARAEMRDSGINVSLMPEKPILGYKAFNLNKDNYIFMGRDKRVSARVDLISDDYTGVKIYSADENKDALQDITVSLNKFDLDKITAVMPFVPRLGGLLFGDFHVIQDKQERLTVMSDMSVSDFSFDGSYIGNISSEFAYMMRDSASHFVGARINHDDNEVGLLRGRYTGEDGGNLDATLNMNRLPLALVNGFIPDRLIALSGYADGKLTVSGAVSAPKIDGEVYLDSSYITSVPYGLRLRMDNDPVRIVGSNLLFENFTLYSHNDSPLNINGNVDFSDPARMALDLQMRAQNYQLINAKKRPRSVAYGKGFVNFAGRIGGTLDRLSMRGQLDVLGTTDLTYVLTDSPLSSDDRLSEIVTFTDFRDTTTVVKSSAPQLGGLDMELMLNIEQGARIMCALNADQSNYINLEGGGELRLVYSDMDNFQLYGRYTLNEGEMKYALPIIPLKTFHIQQGSYIEFAGNVMNPRLNITATEQVKANVANESGSSRTVLFDCGVKVTKTLQDMGLEFTVDAPEDMTLKNELAVMSVEQRGKIAVTMLTTGMYLADGNTGGFSMNNALNSFLQSEINSITNSAMKSIDMSVGIDQNSDAAGNTSTDYSFQFAKRFWNNRFSFIIGGKVSSGNDNTAAGTQNEAFIDNVSLEYRLDQSAQRYVRLFYNKNADDLLEGEITQYGAGFVWRKKMQSLGELFDFRTKKRKQRDEAANDSTKTDEKDD